MSNLILCAWMYSLSSFKNRDSKSFPNATLVDSGNAIGIRVNNLLKDSKSIEKTDIDTEQNEAFCTSLVKLDSNLENTFKKNGFDEILEFKI